MITYLLIVWMNGRILLNVPNIPNERACNILLEKIEGDLQPKVGWRYNLKCYKIE